MFKKSTVFRNINITGVLRVMGWLLMIEAVFMLIPMGVSLYFGERDWSAFEISACITAIAGVLLTYRLHARENAKMGKREGYLLTALVWVVFSIFGMLPFILSFTPVPIGDAFFEAMSGFTTTGASVLDSFSHLSKGILLWRALMQWIGGMGIILFTIAIIPMLNSSGGMQMFNAEVTGITHDKIRPRISQTAKSLWTIYLSLTAILTGLLYLGPMDWFESVCHAFGAISTGGFSTANESIAAYNSVYVDLVLIVFMFIGGLNFTLIFKGAHGDFRAFRRNDVFKTYIGVIGVMFVIFVLNILIYDDVTDWKDLTVKPLFQIVSTITSTGYNAVSFESWGPLVLALIFVMMFFGACAGSTSGGAKIDRMLFLFKNCRNEIYRCVYPNTIKSVTINGKVVNPELVNKVIVFLCLYMLVIVSGGVILSAMGVPVVDAFFSAFSCVSNTGLGAGVTGYGSNYEVIPVAGKWVLSLLMLIGRLEIFTVLILFTRTFWHR